MKHKYKLILFCFIIYSIIYQSLEGFEFTDKEIVNYSRNINDKEMLFIFRENIFMIPIENFKIEKFIEHSILHIPVDIVRDGLPWFGSKRDDWIDGKKVRRHLGVDIYYDSLTVLASAAGIIEIAGRNRISGGWIKILHNNGIKTVYIHLSELYVKKGDRVQQGERIGKITKPEGNAINTQLHFSLQIDGKKYDPVPLVKITYSKLKEVIELIEKYEKNKDKYEKLRDEKVKQYKLNNRKK